MEQGSAVSTYMAGTADRDFTKKLEVWAGDESQPQILRLRLACEARQTPLRMTDG
jgi:hypothetical protein